MPFIGGAVGLGCGSQAAAGVASGADDDGLNVATITKAFKGARKPKVQEIIDALTDLGRLSQTPDGHWQG